MYWREYYPTTNAALRAGQLGDLGKVKLTAQQKAAITAAKQEARVAAVKSKLDRKSATQAAKQALKLARIAGKQSLVQAKYAAKIAAQDAKRAGSAFEASQATEAATPLALPDLSAGATSLPFASGGGGGGSPSYAPPEAAAPEVAEDSPFGIPMPVLLGVGALVIFIVLRK